MVTVAAFEVALRVLLVRVRRRQRRVDIEHRLLRARPELPRALARERNRAAQPRKALSVDRVDHPKRRRVRRHAAEQILLVAQRAQIREAVAAVGEHHDQVAQHDPRIMRRRALPRRRHRRRQRPRQPQPVRRTDQQRAARVTDLTSAVRRDNQLVHQPITLHHLGDPPEPRIRASQPASSLLRRTFPRPGNPGARFLLQDPCQDAFSELFTHTSTEWAPWYVIPADRKWFARVAAGAVIAHALIDIDPRYPALSDDTLRDLQAAKRRLEDEAPDGAPADPFETPVMERAA